MITPEPRMVRLLQCTRRSCQRVFPDDEVTLAPPDKKYGGRKHQCPHCGCTVFAPLHPDGRRETMRDQSEKFDLNTLPAIPVHPKAGKRVKEGIAALVRRLTGEKPAAGPEWVQSRDAAPGRGFELVVSPLLTLAVCGVDTWMVCEPGTLMHAIKDRFPTPEAAQSAAIARAVELVEGTLAILKP